MIHEGAGTWVVAGAMAALLAAGCSDSTVAPVADGSRPDVRALDAALPDGRAADLPGADLPLPDLHAPDLPSVDLANPDLPPPDLPPPDLAKPDLPPPDLPPPDLAKPDLSMPDQAKPDLPLPDGPSADVSPPTGCGKALLPYSGGLCGPKAKPCKVKISEKVPVPTAVRNAGPSLAPVSGGAVDLLIPDSTKGQVGYLAHRSGAAKWQVTKVAMSVTAGTLMRPTAGGLSALIYGWYGSGKTTTYWAGSAGGAWKKVDAPPASQGGYPGTTQMDQAGCVHAIYYRNDGSGLNYGVRSSGWKQHASMLGFSRSALALAPNGVAHLTTWRAAWPGKPAGLYWAVPGLKEELVSSAGGTATHTGQIGMALAATAGGEVELLAYRWDKAFKKRQLIHVRRPATGGWVITPLAQTTSTQCGQCQVGLCNYDYHEYAPLAAVASASGDVRLLYAHRHRKGTLQGKKPHPFGYCQWHLVSDSSTGDVSMAWYAGAKVQTATVATGIKPLDDGVAHLDSKGQIHMAFQTLVPGSQGFTTDIRYLVVGP